MATGEQNAWVGRVLNVEIPAARRPAGLVAYRKLLLDWRAAQSRVQQAVVSLGASILARDDVKSDPRLAQVREAVRAMPTLIPQFGGELEDLIDAALTAGPGEKATASLAAAHKAIPRYRTALATAAGLAGLERVAATHLGPVELLADLDRALGALDDELATRTAGG